MKICGITRAEDADLAAELGASALGFVFWSGSPRYIRPEAAREIVRRSASRVKSVGVFVDEPEEQVVRVMESVGLDVAQLHGHESPAYCRGLARLHPGGFEGASVIKAIGVEPGSQIALDEFGTDVLILLDAQDPSRHGGTGQTVDWDSARRIAASRPTILAGGLNAENVARAVESVRPYGVDVSSGVESAPGLKDRERLRSFFEALNG